METARLIASLKPDEIRGNIPPEITGITDDSREASAGVLFFALRGVNRDGHDFLHAVQGTAAAVVVERFTDGIDLPQIRVGSTRDAFFSALQLFSGFDIKEFLFTGVTGTNGKTTFTYLMESILTAAGRKAGIIGTVNYRCGGFRWEASHTTPDLKTLFTVFREFHRLGCRDIVMEVSSHALSQGRVNGIRFDAAVFTNLTQDHLDFHQDMETYYQAKKLLFKSHLKERGFCVINMDDNYGERLKIELGTADTIGISFQKKADFSCRVVSSGSQGQEIGIIGREYSDIVATELKGGFNAYNVAVAYVTALKSGIEPRMIREGIARVKSIPGRLEEVRNNAGVTLFVDYAHTPDALLNVLKAVHELSGNRVITVFGCGGDRDRAKRPLMGKIAAENSDLVILTSDNPRSEDPVAIIEEIRKGVDPAKRVFVQPNREKAIYDAVYSAKKGDIILVAGKGHENYQITGNEKRFFSDQQVAAEALKRRECLEERTN